MEHRKIAVTATAIAELRKLLESNRDQGVETFIKPFREFCERHGWDWFGLEPKRLFNINAMQLFAAYCHGCYSDERLRQLRESGFAHWVFRADPDCPDEHRQFDGVVLATDHGFWDRYFPPLGWQCSCYVVGTHSRSGIARLGGDPDKGLPASWTRIDPATELPPGIEEPWGTPGSPDLLLLLAAMVDGHAPKPSL